MDVILNNFGLFLSAIGGTGVFTFLFTKGKYKVDVLQAKENAETTAIDNDVKLSSHYKEILDDLKQRYGTGYKEYVAKMQRKIDLLEEENKLKDRKIKLQQIEIAELKRENRQLKANAKASIQNNGTLTSAFELALENGLSITEELTPGDSIKVPESNLIETTIVSFFQRKGQIIATAFNASDGQDILPKLGIGTMAIESTFIVG